MMSFSRLPTGGRFRLAGVLRALALCSLLGAAPAAFAHLNDNFDRADNATIGGGWIEKNPGAFSLTANGAAKLTVGTGYRDNLVYRPAAEDVRDVEAAVELQLATGTPGYPQLAVRVQSATVANADTFDGYLLYVPNSTTELILGRQNGTAFVTALATLALSEPLTPANRYRLRLAARGTNPVLVDAFVERLDVAIWITIGQASVTDSDAERIATAGSVAFGGYVESGYSYDNFTRVDLGALGTTNPAPVTAALSPTQANAGESGVTVVVYGGGFTTDSVARWNGASRTTTYVSPSELELQATTADVAAPGSAAVTVANPTPGGGVSNAQAFTIANPGSPPPAITTLSPSSVTAGAAAFTLIVQGTGFNAGSVVRWGGQDRATTFISTTEVRGSIAAADVANPGSVAITVARTSDGSVSTASTFTIGPVVAGDFVDSFDRANASVLGNGWIEKNAAAFSIVGNEVSKVGAGSDYRNNITYRPASEDLLDTEASVELRPLSTAIGYPQLMVRVQSATVAVAGQLDAYLLFMSDSTSQAVLARQRGTEFTTWLTTFNVSPSLNTSSRYRLRLSATGTNPVQLAGFVELWTGAAWQIIGQGTTSDAAANRISTAGAVGFSGYTETSNRYDNFRRTNLGGAPTPNPVPVGTSLSPTSAAAGTAAFTLTVNGSNFIAGSLVRWNGATRTTTVVSATQLTAAITAADIATQGSATVTVFNPTPGGGVSGNLAFTITAPPPNNPVPTATSLSPSQATAGDAAFTLTVNGSNFVNGATVRWNGANRTTTFGSSTQLTAAITAADIASQGSATVTVFNPTPGGGTSGNLAFTITAPNNPVPTATGLSPPQATAGGAAFTLTVNGSNFVNGAVVRWNGSNRTTTFGSSTQLTAAIAAGDIASQGSATVTVFNPTPGGGTSGGLTFTITAPNNPVPVATSLNPASAAAGTSAFTLTVNGSNFVNGAVVRWNGSNRTTTFGSGTQLTAAITAADIASQGSATVTVFNPTPGGGTSGGLTFTINPPNNPVPTATSLSPSQATAGGGAFTLTVNGSNFVNGATVRWNGSNRTTTFGSSTQLTAAITAADIASQGSATVTVFNPTPGGGTSGGLTFTINPANNPAPTLSSISPTSTPAGGPAFTLTLTGSNFISGSIARWNGSNRSTTFVSSTQLTAAISASDIASQGSASVTVFNPTPGGGTSTARTFTISQPSPNNPLPVVTSMSPSTWPTGGGSFTLTVLGSGFNSQSVIQWNGSTRTTTLVSGSELRATLSSTDVAAAGPVSVSVFAPTPGGGRSVPLTFLVQSGSAQYFIDTFNRADNANVGNGWIEKDPNAFSLTGSEVLSVQTSQGFPYTIMYRPFGESRLDVEASVEIRRLPNVPGNLSLSNFPQLHARVQTNNVATPGSLNSYLFFLWDTAESPQAMFAINTAPQPGVRYECFIKSVPLSEALVTDGRYRLRFRVRGTSPVTLLGSVDRFVNGAWSTIGSGSATHDASTQLDPSLPCDGSSLPAPITNAGVMGLAKWENRTDAYDNYYWRDALASESIPAISSFQPTSVTAGTAGFTLRVLGSGFRQDSVVRWYGSARPTTFISTTEVRATITAADIALSGSTPVTVTGDMGQLSAEGLFSITPVSGTVSFDDSFNRANAGALGNGWIEKTASAFAISGNVVTKVYGSGDYRDNIVYRPAAEVRLDAEALLEFRMNWEPIGYPQVLTRLQPSTITTPDVFDGYLLFIDNDSTQAVIARQRQADSFYTALANITLSQALVAGRTYRMRLSTVGTAPVSLQGTIERLNAGVWQVIGQASVLDSSAERITTAGTVGFSGHDDELSYVFDNFRRVNIGP